MSDWLNNHDWRENIPSPLNRTDLDRWQSELDAIVGVEPDGTHRWRLIWGQSSEATVWNRYSCEWMPRYPAGFTRDYVANPTTGLIELKKAWYGIPRYFVEALLPRIHRNEETERPGKDPDDDPFTERRVVGPEYVMMFCVTEHDHRITDGWRRCCLRRMRRQQTCYGKYRPPDQRDIDTLREDYHLRVTSKMCRPDEKPTTADKNLFYHMWMLDHMRDEKERSEKLDDSSREILSTILKMSGTSFNSKKNRYSIPGELNGNSANIRSRP